MKKIFVLLVLASVFLNLLKGQSNTCNDININTGFYLRNISSEGGMIQYYINEVFNSASQEDRLIGQSGLRQNLWNYEHRRDAYEAALIDVVCLTDYRPEQIKVMQAKYLDNACPLIKRSKLFPVLMDYYENPNLNLNNKLETFSMYYNSGSDVFGLLDNIRIMLESNVDPAQVSDVIKNFLNNPEYIIPNEEIFAMLKYLEPLKGLTKKLGMVNSILGLSKNLGDYTMTALIVQAMANQAALERFIKLKPFILNDQYYKDPALIEALNHVENFLIEGDSEQMVGAFMDAILENKSDILNNTDAIMNLCGVSFIDKICTSVNIGIPPYIAGGWAIGVMALHQELKIFLNLVDQYHNAEQSIINSTLGYKICHYDFGSCDFQRMATYSFSQSFYHIQETFSNPPFPLFWSLLSNWNEVVSMFQQKQIYTNGVLGGLYSCDDIPPWVSSVIEPTYLNDNISILFSEDILQSSITSSSILLSGSISGSIPCSFNYNESDNRLVIDPQNSLVENEVVVINLLTTIKDISNNGLDGDGNGITGPNYIHSFLMTIKNQIIISSAVLSKTIYSPAENAIITVTLGNSLTGTNVNFTVDNGLPIVCNEVGNGVYQIAFTAPLTTGLHNIVVNASKTGYQAAISYNTSINVANAGLTLSCYPSEIQFDGSTTSTITATLLNALGQPMSSIPIQFFQSSGTLTPVNTVTNSQGVAQISFLPDQVGVASIQATAQTTNNPSGSTTVKIISAGTGTYTIKLTYILQETSSSSATYKLAPFVTYSSNGQGVEAINCTLTTNLGNFQNGTKTYTQILGNLDDPGTLLPAPLITTSVSGSATIIITVGPTSAIFTIPMSIGLIPQIQPFYTLTNALSTNDAEHELDWSADGKLFAYTPGRIVKFPSFEELFAGPTENTFSLSFSKTGQNIVMGSQSDNPVFYLYNTVSKIITPCNPSNVTTNSVVWSNENDDYKFALANKYTGFMNQIIIYTGSGLTRSYLSIDGTTDEILGLDWKGNYLAAVTSGGSIYLYNTSTMTRMWKSSIDRPFKQGVSISPDKSKVAVLGRKYSGYNNLYIFNINSSTPIGQYGLGSENGDYYSVDWAPDGSKIVCSGYSSSGGYIKIIDPTNGTELYDLISGTTQEVYGVRWSSQNIISALYGTTVKFYAPFDAGGPEINITYPPSGFKTMYDTVHIKGVIADVIGVKSAELKLNSGIYQPLTLLPDGNFDHIITVGLDQNDIQIRAADRLDKSSNVLRTVFKLTPFANVDPQEITLSYNAGSSSTFSISSNTAWSLTKDASWFDINYAYGMNDVLITVTANSINTNSVSNRLGMVTLSGENLIPKTVSVRQSSAPYINISGNSGMPSTTLTYTDGTLKSITTDVNGNYSFIVPYLWSGTVVPSNIGYVYNPANRSYTNSINNQSSQDYTATPITYTISGNTGISGVSISYYDGFNKSAISDASGIYTLVVSYNWNGNVIPSKTGYSFTPESRDYTNVKSNYASQNYVLNTIFFTIRGNAGTEGVMLSYTNGTVQSAMSDADGNYSLAVPYNWNGTVTPDKTSYLFTPIYRTYSNVNADRNDQDYAAGITTNLEMPLSELLKPKVIPNPSKGIFAIEIPMKDHEKLYLEIVSSTGSKVYAERIISGNALFRKEFNFTSSPGLYLIKVVYKNRTEVCKLIIR